jgi:hypothetical protein
MFNLSYGSDRLGFEDLTAVHWNLQAPQLYAPNMLRRQQVISCHSSPLAQSPGNKFLTGRDGASLSWSLQGDVSQKSQERWRRPTLLGACGKKRRQ